MLTSIPPYINPSNGQQTVITVEAIKKADTNTDLFNQFKAAINSIANNIVSGKIVSDVFVNDATTALVYSQTQTLINAAVDVIFDEDETLNKTQFKSFLKDREQLKSVLLSSYGDASDIVFLQEISARILTNPATGDQVSTLALKTAIAASLLKLVVEENELVPITDTEVFYAINVMMQNQEFLRNLANLFN